MARTAAEVLIEGILKIVLRQMVVTARELEGIGGYLRGIVSECYTLQSKSIPCLGIVMAGRM